jgi:hypothetical protein
MRLNCRLESLSDLRLLGLQLAFALHDYHVWALEADKNDAVPVHEVDGLVIVACEHLGRIRYDDSAATAGQIDDHGRLSECSGELESQAAARRQVMASLHSLCQVGAERKAAIKLLADDVVALAGGLLKAFPVENGDLAPAVGDVARAMQA